MKVVISSGHGKYVRGASGYIDEVDEARKVVNRCAEIFRSVGVEAMVFHDDVSTSQNENLERIVNFHNSKTRDYDVSVHFNAYNTTTNPMGTECLYVTQQGLAGEVSLAVADAADLINRGAKKRTDLYFLNKTEEPSILIETCFVDSKADVELYHQHFEGICTAIVEAVSGEFVSESPEPPPVNNTERLGVVQGVPANDWLNVRASNSSSGTVIGKAYNQDTLAIVGESGNWYKCEFVGEVTVYGWVSKDYVRVEGAAPPSEEFWHESITATQFGGDGDEQEGAYGNYITGKTRGVALPYKWRDSPRPRVIVSGPKGEVETDVVDVGPWNIDDPDYVLGEARPMVEDQYEEGLVAQNGMVPTNDAAIDLTDPIAKEVGISGKGTVRWRLA